MNQRMSSKLLWAVATVIVLASGAGDVALRAMTVPKAQAQYPIDQRVLLCVFQDGIQVGEIYNDRIEGQETYVEHWVLNDSYVPIGPGGQRAATVEECPQRYSSVREFLANVGWGKGFKYIHVTAHESDALPVVSDSTRGLRRGR